MTDPQPSETASELLARARAELAAVAKEELGAEKNTRFRGHRIVPVGQAWHVGVLLLTDDAVLATAEVLRAADAGRRGYTAESARERAQRRELAMRGGFRPGDVVHVGWTRIDLAAVDVGRWSGPLGTRDGVVVVQWSATGEPMPLTAYLRERIALLRGV